MMAAWEKYLEKIYNNPNHPGSFSGPSKLYLAVKNDGKFRIGMPRIRKWLQGNSTYTFNRIAHRKFARNEVVVAGIDAIWDSDLIDLAYYGKQNDSNNYILLAIDIFSRYTWLRPLKTKSSENVIPALKNIIDEGRKPTALRTDKGKEFTNVAISKFYKEEEIHHYVTFNDTQANYAERCIKTIKTKIFRYMKKNNTHRYIDVLQDIVTGYNNSVHRSLGKKPISINKVNEDESRLDQYLLKHGRKQKSKEATLKKEDNSKTKKKENKVKAFSLKVGDDVRVSMIKEKFDREYDQKWSTETFRVAQRFRRENINLYAVADWFGEVIEGSFYRKELQKIIVKDNEEYEVEKIVKKEGKNVFVKWRGWPKKYNTWMPLKDIRHLIRE